MDKEYSAPNHLNYHIYLTAGQEPKAAILLLHGMQEHSGRYLDFAKHLNQQRYAVITYDHVGHGHTAKSKAEMGFFRKRNPDGLLIYEAKQMAYFMQSQFPDTPLILMGHSMGSFIARLLLQQTSGLFSGAIIMGTGSSNPAAILFRPILYVANAFAPKKRSRWLNKLFTKINNKEFKNEHPNDGTNWLSANPANREAFQADELCGLDFSNNAFYGLISLNVKATKTNWADSLPKQMPLLFVSGSEDPIGNFGKGVKKTVKNLQTKGFTNVTIQLFPHMRHEILNEIDRQSVYTKIIDWLDDLTTNA
ncbi:alpha/beta hydrolase [Sphingobacterium sp. UT-1RO-CII-1]|uniref:alpha/beta fold hydrolase n=1 Tax=Sphingobacterium sp. UT-1RO-CII-1 TaxID=2995225 RepID=UPI00227C1B5E|nr:alpha/beta hydrolase [Sphingobacterium sp. UT-1RO-CII-1]MCY4779140.1 alpha/beta hydrolase [Sphingobacterium sp. UT-1RO-CII-1]